MNQTNPTNNDGFKKSVFISHASKNFKIADEIRSLLEARGVSCWIAPRNIPGGYQYGTAIIEAIRDCTMTLLVLTDESNQSSAVRNEIERAFSYQKTIVPVRLRALAPSKELEFFVSNAQWVDAFASPLKGRVEQVINIVHALELKQPVPQPQPEKPTLGGKLELFFERALRHKLLSSLAAFSILAALITSVLWMQIGSHEDLKNATSAIGSSATKIEVAASNIEQTSSTIKQVDSKLDLVKKETSDNPRKELANRGITWEVKNFSTAVKNQDVETVRLFLEGGMPIRRFEMRDALLSSNTDITDIFTLHAAKIQIVECNVISEWLVEAIANEKKISDNAKILFTAACGKNDVAKRELSRQLEVQVRSRDSRIAEERKELKSLGFPGYDKCIDWAMRDGGRALIRESLAKYYTVSREDNGSYQYRLYLTVGLEAKQKERDGHPYNPNELKMLVSKKCKEIGEIKVDEQRDQNWISAYRSVLGMFV